MKAICLLALCLTGCSAEDMNITPPQHEFTFCKFYSEGVCVIKYSESIDINPEVLSKYLGIMEYEVNYFYPGLDFDMLAQENNLKLIYRWADSDTEYQGQYRDYETAAHVWLRRGENITAKMQCTDRYFVAVHEVLHFIVERYMLYDDSIDAHNIPNIFTHWALLNNLPTDCTVESRLYTLIARYCFEQ